MTAVEFIDVRYDSAGPPTLGPIDLRIAPGERVAFVSHDGATTLLRLVTGDLEPTTGRIRVGGFEAGSAAARSFMSVMPDPNSLAGDLTLLEHLERAASEAPGDDWRADADDLVRRFALDDRLGDRLAILSRGMRQKSAVCMALVRRFEILVLDEPFGGLDAAGRSQLRKVLDVAHGLGATLLVGSDDGDAIAASSRVVGLRDGIVAFDGSAGDDLDAFFDVG